MSYNPPATNPSYVLASSIPQNVNANNNQYPTAQAVPTNQPPYNNANRGIVPGNAASATALDLAPLQLK
jgi:hypothetical protein